MLNAVIELKGNSTDLNLQSTLLPNENSNYYLDVTGTQVILMIETAW